MSKDETTPEEKRLARLEEDIRKLRHRIRELESDTKALIAEVERLKRMISHVLGHFRTAAFMECSDAEHCEEILSEALEQKE